MGVGVGVDGDVLLQPNLLAELLGRYAGMLTCSADSSAASDPPTALGLG